MTIKNLAENLTAPKPEETFSDKCDSKSKIYKNKNLNWFCPDCDIFCNSESQYNVHMISQKHKFVLEEEKRKTEDSGDLQSKNVDQSNEPVENDLLDAEKLRQMRLKTNFSMAEIAQNPLAIRFNINAVKYLITEDKKQGKFEKFGFYCKTCDAYMTGQIQLIMHVRGAKHQHYHPNEIPDYKATKVYNPSNRKKRSFTDNRLSNQNNSKSNYNSTPIGIASKFCSRTKPFFEQSSNNSKMDQSYPNFKNGHNMVSSPFNEPYSFQEQIQQLVYNFKMHPIYAYHMLINQRLKQNQLIHDMNSSELIHNSTQNFHDQCNQSQQLLDNNTLPYNNQYDHYAHYNQQNMFAYQNQATSFMHKQPNYQQMSMPNQLKFSQMNISPIPYILPQTPQSSLNQTPIIKKQITDEKNLNNFNSFATPPSSGSFSYYSNIQHH